MLKYSKASAPIIAGAIVTAIAQVVTMTTDMQTAVVVILTSLLVWAIPNR